MYFGTVARLYLKPGMLDRFLAYGEEQRQRIDDFSGGVATLVFQSDTDPLEFYLVAVAESEEHYRAQAASPEQHQQYLRMREMLQEDPEWHDGHVLFAEFRATND
jgi:quinol monooxygenase YgiN